MKTDPDYRNPIPTVDIIIEIDNRIILIQRRNPPLGWALPGGFVDYGESVEAAAIREAREETSLKVTLKEQFHVYSDPDRDPRQHTLTTVFIAEAKGSPEAKDDAKKLGLFNKGTLPSPLVFDHQQILSDYFRYKEGTPRADIFSPGG
jgi:ADP-ribose pyrophosphatase YjhB (NUDIX family)